MTAPIFSGSGFFFTLLYRLFPIKSAKFVRVFHLIYHHSTLPLSAGNIMIFSSCINLMASLSSFEMFGFGYFDFSSTCLTFHLSSSAWALEIFKAASSIGAIKSKKGIPLW